MIFRNTTWLTVLALAIVTPTAGQLHGQRITYKMVDVKRTVDVPVTKRRWVEETTLETETEKRYKQINQTETRQRVRFVEKPVKKTKYRTERTVVPRQVTVEKVRERKTRHTTHKTVTGVREETVTVTKPVVETEMRTETVVRQRPVSKELIEVKRTTTMKPVVKKETTFDVVPGVPLYQAVPDTNRRPRVRFLSPGYYADPTTGASIYRRRGLHWVQPNSAVPVARTPDQVLPREVERIEFEPEVVETRKPITVTRMVEETVQREIPYEVRKTVQQQETRKVPYQYQIPVDRVVVEQIPYTETEYREEVVERKVPYTVTEMQRVRVVEDYEVVQPRWVEETVSKKKPIRRWVEKSETIIEKKTLTETMKVPVDAQGNPLSAPVPLDAPEYEFANQLPSVTTATVRKPNMDNGQADSPLDLRSSDSVIATEKTIIPGADRTTAQKPAAIVVPETSTKLASIDPPASGGQTETSGKTSNPTLTPETDPDAPPAVTVLSAEMPPALLSDKTGNENAADY